MESKQVVAALAALAQETRLAIYRVLIPAGRTGLAAGEIAAAVGAPAATISFHLKELSYAGLVSSRAAGRYIFYSANFERMTELVQFLTENCCAADGADCGVRTPGAAPARSPAARVPRAKTKSTAKFSSARPSPAKRRTAR